MQRIKRSQVDINTLMDIDLLGVNPSNLVGFDFSGTAVVKPWGYEYMVYESPDKSICAWVLHLNNNGVGNFYALSSVQRYQIGSIGGGIIYKHDRSGDKSLQWTGSDHRSGSIPFSYGSNGSVRSCGN